MQSHFLFFLKFIKICIGFPSSASTRCLIQLFKAVGSLSLCVSNIHLFISAGIVEALDHVFHKSHSFSDHDMIVFLRTLSNLVMEFSQESMKIFACLLPSVISMLNQEGRKNFMMLSLAFDTLGALCRITENAQVFHELKGYAVVLRHLKTLKFEEQMNIFGLKLLTRQIRMFPESSLKVIDEGI